MREIIRNFGQGVYDLLGHAIVSKDVKTTYHITHQTIIFSPYVLGVNKDGQMCCLLYLHTPKRVQGADLVWKEENWLCIPLSSFAEVDSVQDPENEQWIETDRDEYEQELKDRDLEVYVKVLL